MTVAEDGSRPGPGCLLCAHSAADHADGWLRTSHGDFCHRADHSCYDEWMNREELVDHGYVADETPTLIPADDRLAEVVRDAPETLFKDPSL